jgi:hypothetical protein
MSHVKSLHENNKGVIFWAKFRKKHKKYKEYSRHDLRNIMNDLLYFLGENIATNKHGIVLNGIGYFGNAVFYKRKISGGRSKDAEMINNFGTTDNIYECTFHPDIFPRNPFRNWLFNSSVHIKQRMKEEIEKGMRYKYHGDILKRNKRAVKYYLQDDNV